MKSLNPDKIRLWCVLCAQRGSEYRDLPSCIFCAHRPCQGKSIKYHYKIKKDFSIDFDSFKLGWPDLTRRPRIRIASACNDFLEKK